jgi:tetratricopeptide (TPR) repeat protein
MMLSRIIGSLSLAGLVWIHVIEGVGVPQSCDFQGPLPHSQSRLKAKNASGDQHWFLRALPLDLVNSGAFAAYQASPETPSAKKPVTRTEKIREWSKAVAQHATGRPDPAAVMIGNWQEKDLETVISYVTKLASQSPNSVKRTLAKASIRRLLQLTDQDAKQGSLNRLLTQGALLHTDVALLELGESSYQNAGEGMAAFADGRFYIYPKTPHWEFARKLIDAGSPLSSRDPMVRQWYIATTAHMQARRLPGYAGQNLKRALERFPADPRLLLYTGVLHETWASATHQNVVLPRAVKVSYGSEESELKLALQFFQKAVAADPNFAEARLRLGRVMGLLGHHDRAVLELQSAAASINDPQPMYYASLFLGHEFASLSRRSEARDQYERAARLYPAAQSPLLALSQLARSGDDLEGAWISLKRVFALPRKDPWKDDPWWIYDLAHVRDADALIAEMHKMFGGLLQ